MTNPPKIIAHRGASAHAPENTLAAFRLAMAIGAQGVEFDVQLSRDGVPVVVHDELLTRYTRAKERVDSLSARQLGRTDVGSWFNRKYRRRARPEFGRETIPTLAQVLDLLTDFHGPIYVELKCSDSNFRDLSRAVCDLVREHPGLPQIIIKSFKLAVLPEVRHHIADIKTAALFAPEIMHLLRRREHIIALAHEFGADHVSVHYSLLTRRLASLAHEVRMPLTVWTVDDPKWLRRRASWGLYAVITNDPAKLISSLDT